MSDLAHPSVAYGKTGILLVNLGTPESPDAKGLRPYLKQFLSDRRVIETSPIIWQPILRGIILNTRPRKSARAYAKIWNKETDESPLRYFTRTQAEKLHERFGDGLEIEWAMRYGAPSIADKLAALKARGCERISVIALYPQYSASTSASVYDDVFRALLDMRWQPAVRTAAPWHDMPAYITALAASVRAHYKTLDWKPDVLVASFHGLPQMYFDKGDPYHCHCAKTARLLREKLKLPEDRFKLTFQSRFGPTKWLEPYTDKTVEDLASDGTKKLAVITPGFVSDCVETLEEINIELRETFEAAGGTHFTTVPCLNDAKGGVTLLEKIVKREISGW
ncbi:MAG TPA: ferrochelatase [Rhodobiaceae bacterium]|nr:ferrochelatase [Rhodobiaceae bacterium]